MHKELFAKGLEEDDWKNDWTTRGVVQSRSEIRAQILAKSDGVWAGDGFTQAAIEFFKDFKEKKLSIECQSSIRNGGRLSSGVEIMVWKGDPLALLALERTYLNLVSYFSGIATATRRLVQIVHDACPVRTPQILHTRKIFPGCRMLAIEAVLIGGGHAHRKNLSDAVLIKENHIAMAGSISAAVSGVRAVAPRGVKFEIEVQNFSQLREVLNLGVDVVMLDNFSSSEVREAVNIVRKAEGQCKIEVSGGVSEKNIAEYAMEGVDYISAGSLTHSVKSVDLSFLVLS